MTGLFVFVSQGRFVLVFIITVVTISRSQSWPTDSLLSFPFCLVSSIDIHHSWHMRYRPLLGRSFMGNCLLDRLPPTQLS